MPNHRSKSDSSDEDEFDDNLDKFLQEYESASFGPDSHQKLDRIPYNSIYSNNDDEHGKMRLYFIPSAPVRARITNVRRDEEPSRHVLNPYIYTIELEHGPYTWTIERKFSDFRKLHRLLKLFRANERIKAPARRLDHESNDKTHESKDHRDKQHDNQVFEHEDPVYDDSKEVENQSENEPIRPLRHSEKQLVNLTLQAFEHAREKSTEPPRHQPKFPQWPERILSDEDVQGDRRRCLETWLTDVLEVAAYRNNKDTARFLGVSRLSFVDSVGIKAKEGLVRKRPGGGRVYRGCQNFCLKRLSRWTRRWLLIKDSYIAYLNPRTEEIRAVLLYDKDLEVKCGAAETGGVRHGLFITVLARHLFLKCTNHSDAEEWRRCIHEVAHNKGKTWMEEHRFLSFAPERKDAYASWFVDAKSYMEHAAKLMMIAQEEIMICNWWLSPEIFMKRPIVEGDRWRLDQILKRKAEQGVRIFVLLYKEVAMALGINSAYTKRTLTGLHPNIHVMRHPDHIFGRRTSAFLWAHHEKLIVIDQSIAFLGGIDLCFGRWDDRFHRLTDMGNMSCSPDKKVQSKRMPAGLKEMAHVAPAAVGIHKGLPEERDAGITEVEVPQRPESRRTKLKDAIYAIMGKSVEKTAEEDENPVKNEFSNKPVKTQWHHVFKHSSKKHDAVLPQNEEEDPSTPKDFAAIVQQYKEYVKSGRAEEDKRRCDTPPLGRHPSMNRWKQAFRKHKLATKKKGQDERMYESFWRRLNEDHPTGPDSKAEGKLWLGKDYVNFIFKDFTQLDMPFHDFIDRCTTPRMPWHDMGACVYGAPARDVARHFIQRWNYVKVLKLMKDSAYPMLLPKAYDNISIPRVFQMMSHACHVQIVRSVSQWSAGIKHVEDSIHEAYKHLISTAEHYVYMENQFFITMIDSNYVSNQICTALRDRIVKAHQQNQTFRVYILLPLLPGFEGDVGATQGSALQAVLHWQYMSIGRGDNSLLAQLKKAGVPDPTKYIAFCGLRTHDILNDKPITELTYIHSKIIVVDDRRALIGSANINDRSMLGKRDSELATYIEDCEFFDSVMNGEKYQAGRFAGSLRLRLMKEHLGLLEEKNIELAEQGVNKKKNGCEGKLHSCKEKPRSNVSAKNSDEMSPSENTEQGTSDPETDTKDSQKRDPEKTSDNAATEEDQEKKEGIDARDPISDHFYNEIWLRIAAKNTAICEKVYRCLPSDEVRKFVDLKRYHEQKALADEEPPDAATEELKGIRGSLVLFPINFLQDENLQPSFVTKEGLVPTSFWT